MKDKQSRANRIRKREGKKSGEDSAQKGAGIEGPDLFILPLRIFIHIIHSVCSKVKASELFLHHLFQNYLPFPTYIDPKIEFSKNY